MKKLLVICFFITIACNKPKPLLKYRVTIHTNESNDTGKLINEETKLDIILAKNDTIAFYKGLKKVSSDVQAILKAKGKTSYAVKLSFVLTDPSGRNLKKKLSPKLLDSLTKVVRNEMR